MVYLGFARFLLAHQECCPAKKKKTNLLLFGLHQARY
jgi:hypothetical protein